MKLIFIFMNQWAHVKSRLHHMGGVRAVRARRASANPELFSSGGRDRSGGAHEEGQDVLDWQSGG